jgi:predicted transposase YbfD/YdcC
LQTFLELPYGVPSHDTFERVFARLNPEAFQSCFRQWMQTLAEHLGVKQIAIDGKTLRGSGQASTHLGPLHLVSAWATQNHLTLGQVAVADESNEITAIPKLLELLELNGALVTIDAIGCQKEIAQQIVAGGGDYVLTVKDNQPHLLADIQEAFLKALDHDFAGLQHDSYRTKEKGHGRQETRWYHVIYDPAGIRNREAWPELKAIGMCYSERTIGEQTSMEVRYFIGSRQASARTYGKALRNHWRIENNLHWQLDVTFGEDGNRVRERNTAENLALVRRIALTGSLQKAISGRFARAQAFQHQTDHGDSYEGLADTRIPFIILAQATTTPQPTEGPLDDPTPLQHHEPRPEGTPDDLQHNPECRQNPDRQVVAAIAAVGPQPLQPRETLLGLTDHLVGPVVVLHVRRLHDQGDEEPQGIHNQVTLASLDLLARIETFGTTYFRGLDTLGVNDAGAGLGVSPLGLAHSFVQGVVNPVPQAADTPAVELGRHGAPGWEIVGELAPLATGAKQVEDGVEDVAAIHLSWSSRHAGAASRQQGPDQIPLFIR